MPRTYSNLNIRWTAGEAALSAIQCFSFSWVLSTTIFCCFSTNFDSRFHPFRSGCLNTNRKFAMRIFQRFLFLVFIEDFYPPSFRYCLIFFASWLCLCAVCNKPQFIRHTKSTRKTISREFFADGRFHFTTASAGATSTITIIVIALDERYCVDSLQTLSIKWPKSVEIENAIYQYGSGSDGRVEKGNVKNWNALNREHTIVAYTHELND